jgi:hypothetical protein
MNQIKSNQENMMDRKKNWHGQSMDLENTRQPAMHLVWKLQKDTTVLKPHTLTYLGAHLPLAQKCSFKESRVLLSTKVILDHVWYN